MRSLCLPDGEKTEDLRRWNREWENYGRTVCTLLGPEWRPAGFDKNLIVVRDTDNAKEKISWAVGQAIMRIAGQNG